MNFLSCFSCFLFSSPNFCETRVWNTYHLNSPWGHRESDRTKQLHLTFLTLCNFVVFFRTIKFTFHPSTFNGKESACQCRSHGFNPWVGHVVRNGNHSSILYCKITWPEEPGRHAVVKCWTQLSDWTRIHTSTLVNCHNTFMHLNDFIVHLLFFNSIVSVWVLYFGVAKGKSVWLIVH